eukprot:jgi/Psemu1/288877/fgenesh1_pg.295_\
MSFSFSFPHKPLLHKTIEDQWFDRSPKETQSSLTALELAEEAHMKWLTSITMPDKPPVVIGKLQHLRFEELQAQRTQADQQQQQQQHGSQSPMQRTRRSGNLRRSAAEMESRAYPHPHGQTHDAYGHAATDATDDLSTVVNPNRGHRSRTVVASTASPAHHQATMFWNRSRRSSAGGDRLY